MEMKDMVKRVREVIFAHGHENIRALHGTTLEITKNEELTPRGDCIIAVGASKAVRDLSENFKSLARRKNATIIVRIEAEGIKDEIHGKGDPRLIFGDPESMVIRKSTYICPRTLMIKANKAAKDIRRDLIELIKKRSVKIKIELEVLAN